MVRRLDKYEALALLEAERSRDPGLAACTMCRLLGPDHAAARVAENEAGIVVLDRYAATEGHLLVIAREHVERATAVDWPTYERLTRLVWEASRVLQRTLSPERIYTASLGAPQALPMSFPHLHTHVIPVYETGESARPAAVFSWSAGVTQYEPGEAEQLAESLRKRWPDGATTP